MMRGGQLKAAASALFALTIAAGSASAQTATLSMNIDFFGDESINGVEVRRAVDSMIRNNVVRLGTLANGGAMTVETLLYDYNVVRDKESLQLLSPILCAANAHICRQDRKAAACEGAQCIALGSIAKPASYPVEKCRTQALTGKSARVPPHVLCVPALTMSVGYLDFDAPQELSPKDLSALRRQAGGCEPKILDDCVPRVAADGPLDADELIVRRLRLSVPVSTADAQRRFEHWYVEFSKGVEPLEGDLRPHHLRMKVSTTSALSSQQEIVGDVHLVDELIGDLAKNCGLQGSDCLNKSAFARMNASKFVATRNTLAREATPVLIVERRPPVINPTEGEPPHCAVPSLYVRKANSQQSSDNKTRPGALTETVSSRQPDCTATIWAKDAEFEQDGSQDIRLANHALAVGGLLAANLDYGEGRSAEGILPGLSVYPLASLGEESSPPTSGSSTVVENGVTRAASPEVEQGGLADKYDSAVRKLGSDPTVINVSQAIPLTNADTANSGWLVGKVFNLTKSGSGFPILVAAAGNGSASIDASADQNSTDLTSQQQLDYNKGALDHENCLIWPACLSTKPIINTLNKNSFDVSPFLVSVVGLAADGATPGHVARSSAEDPCSTPQSGCYFHGPAIDIAAIGEANTPTIATIGRKDNSGGAPWSSKKWAYQKKKGSSFAAPFVTGLAAALNAKLQSESLFPKFQQSTACTKAIYATPTPNYLVQNYFSLLQPAKLIRDRILASADFASWEENLQEKRPTKSQTSIAGPNVSNSATPSQSNDGHVYSARYAQFGRLNFDAALDFENDCLQKAEDNGRRLCGPERSIYRGPPIVKNSNLNPLFGGLNADNDQLPSAMQFKKGTLSWTPNDKKDDTTGRRKKIEDALAGSGFTIPVADIRRIERLNHSSPGNVPPLFRVVFVDRFDEKTPFALRHIIGTNIHTPGNTNENIEGAKYKLFDKLPLADENGRLSDTVPPNDLKDYLSAWLSECGRIYRSE